MIAKASIVIDSASAPENTSVRMAATREDRNA
jgi:hypothetical protein